MLYFIAEVSKIRISGIGFGRIPENFQTHDWINNAIFFRLTGSGRIRVENFLGQLKPKANLVQLYLKVLEESLCDEFVQFSELLKTVCC